MLSGDHFKTASGYRGLSSLELYRFLKFTRAQFRGVIEAAVMEFTVLQGSSFAVNRCPPLKAGQMMAPDREPCRRVMSRRDPCTKLRQAE
jgi:hypothetical protein